MKQMKIMKLGENRDTEKALEPETPIKRLQLDIDPELHTRFKAVCSLKQEKMKPLVVGFIEKWLEENEPDWMKGQK